MTGLEETAGRYRRWQACLGSGGSGRIRPISWSEHDLLFAAISWPDGSFNQPRYTADTAGGLRRVEQGHARGKVVITMA